MKKRLFGYKVSEVDVMLNTLREENESLNATITTLNTQIKNSEISGAKANLLEADLNSVEENLAKLTEEKNELLSQIHTISTEAEALKNKNTELIAQNEQLHTQKEELNHALEDAFNNGAEKLTAAAAGESEETQENAREFELAQRKIKQLEEELAITKIAAEYQEKSKASNENQRTDRNLHHAAEISYRAYYDMSNMRNEVIEYIHEEMKEYYQFVNETSVKMHRALEQRQSEYDQMIREFFAKASEFRTSLSNMEDKYSSMADYRLDIDKIANCMDEIMNNFIKETDAFLQKEEETASEKEPNTDKEAEPEEKLSTKEEAEL